MSSDVRTPPDSKRPSAARPPVMAMPDILAMANSGQPAPGQKVSLPSGAVWEGGKVTGTSVITLPGDDPILVAGDSSVSANGITGDSVQIGSLAQAFQEVLGAVPRFFANWIATGALNRYAPEAKDAKTRTRIVRISSRATLSGPVGDRNGDNDSGDEVVDESGVPGSGIEDRTPQRFANGGMVSGSGGPRQDKVLARLSPGEFVVNAAATSNALPLLAAINGGWVPSPAYLGGMLPGFADGGLVGAGGSAAQSWRDLLRNPIAPAGPDAPFRPQDFGLFGLVADVLGGIGNAAINAGGATGAALGSIVAPAFGPGGVLSSVFGSAGTAGAPTQESVTRSDPPDLGEPNPLGAAMQVRTQGTPGALGFGRAYQAPIGTASTGSEAESVRTGGVNPLGSLSTALAHGIVGAATDAGSRVGAALGTVLAPALGPDGSLAPVIGAQLGSLIGAKFGGSLSASMTLTGESGGPGLGASGPTSLGTGESGSGDGGNSVVPQQTVESAEASGGGSSYSGGGSYIYGAHPATAQSPSGSYLVRNRPNNNGLPSGQSTGSLTPGSSDYVPQGDSPIAGTPAVGAAGFGAQSLALSDEIYNPYTSSFKDFLNVAGGKLGGDAASVLAPLLGPNGNQIIEAGAQFGAQQGDALGDLYKSVDPEGKWSSSIAAVVKEYTGIDWSPTGAQTPTPQMTRDQQAGLAALQGGIAGLQQNGLVGGITGAIKGAASTVGSTLGTAAGTLVAPFLGPLGALAPAVGSMIGSMVANTAAEFITKPIEIVASGVKEELGSGFGLTNLAKGPGGRTARGDIYNFNGMDPKSAAIAVERVRRRRTVAQQRGGGLGR
ncbi:hypothetical protein [Nocardia iowensis]|uniref:Uncharacterized protein n=1 Tax=Nocardia iowensis TaxID=204891 RepID=A0ABX8RQV7_NOCIO|nr:hypothetical protein [Nocardia iowensis]QXN91392.1 hypothetical protein KV110_39825 [Nocardia iowensis]